MSTAGAVPRSVVVRAPETDVVALAPGILARPIFPAQALEEVWQSWSTCERIGRAEHLLGVRVQLCTESEMLSARDGVHLAHKKSCAAVIKGL